MAERTASKQVASVQHARSQGKPDNKNKYVIAVLLHAQYGTVNEI